MGFNFFYYYFDESNDYFLIFRLEDNCIRSLLYCCCISFFMWYKKCLSSQLIVGCVGRWNWIDNTPWQYLSFVLNFWVALAKKRNIRLGVLVFTYPYLVFAHCCKNLVFLPRFFVINAKQAIKQLTAKFKNQATSNLNEL